LFETGCQLLFEELKEESLKRPGILQWAEAERPREKMRMKGRQALSDAELLGILIGTGSGSETAVDLGRRVLSKAGQDLNQLGRLSLAELCSIHGIGPAKAITILAALELGRRRTPTEEQELPTLQGSAAVHRFMRAELLDQPREQFWVIYLNQALRPIRKVKIADGGIAQVLVDNRIVFHEALQCLATAMILVHNHPSGKLQPSEEDRKLTHRIVQAGEVLQIRVLDHLIFADGGFFSFSDQGLL
jgi:DNA repair protein RadC